MNWIKKHKILTAIIALGVILGVSSLLFPKDDETANMVEEKVTRRDIVTYNSFVGNLTLEEQRSVIAKASAQVTEVMVEKGQYVQAGDVIATLDSTTLDNNINVRKASLAQTQSTANLNVADAQRTLDNYKEQVDKYLNPQIQAAYNSLDSAKRNMDEAQYNYDKTVKSINDLKSTRDNAKNKLDSLKAQEIELNNQRDALNARINELKAKKDAEGLTTEEEAELTDKETVQLPAVDASLASLGLEIPNAQMAYDSANAAYEAAKPADVMHQVETTLASAKEKYNEAYCNVESVLLQSNQTVANYEANITKAKNSANTTSSQIELNNLIKTKEDYTIKAPVSGVITVLNIQTGSMVNTGSSVATVANLNEMKVAIKIDEYSVLNVHEGDDIQIYIDSIDKSYTGTLSWVSDVATVQNGVSYYEAEATMNADDMVKSGMSVEVRLTRNDERNVVSVSVDALNYHEDNTCYVLKKDGNKTEETDVEVGASDGQYVQIVSGLEEGDIVMVKPSFKMMTIQTGGN